mgnify:CR=1 FL=1
MSLKKESIKVLLSNAFSWNHEEETIYYMIIENLDKITDENVKEIANAMSRYVYQYKGWEEAGQVLRKYGIEFEPYDSDPYAEEDKED